MPWHKDSITPGEIDALRRAAQLAWGEDTRYPLARSGGDSGQCYVTACWLQQRLGGYVGRKNGHYVWLSPNGSDGQWILDLTRHGSPAPYLENHQVSGYKPIKHIANKRTVRFANRADKIFENLDQFLKVADMTGDGLPAQEPQRAEDIKHDHEQSLDPYWHDEPDYQPAEGEYRFVYGNGQLEVSPSHSHEELMGHTGLHPNHRGPIAIGYVVVTNNKATWETDSNMNIKGLSRVFKDYSKHVGWDWGGITHIDGEPISDEFAPKKGHTLSYVYDGHLYIGRAPVSEIALHVGGVLGERKELRSGNLVVHGSSAYVVGTTSPEAIAALYDYCDDNGLILYAGNDNVMDVIPDMELDNNGANENASDQERYSQPPKDEREPSGIYKCPVCQRLFPGWHEYAEHRREEANDYGEMQQEDSGFPENDMDATFPTHFTEQQDGDRGVGFLGAIMPASQREAARVDGFEHPDADEYFVGYRNGSPVSYVALRDGKEIGGKYWHGGVAAQVEAKVYKYTGQEPKDLLEAPLPFIYDVQEDTITVGEPGKRTADIPGRFTPGGIVEGVYEPGGKIMLRTMTNMPYTVRHLVQLWYYQHPELEVKNVNLQDDSGSATKLAAGSVGGTIQSLVAADPTADAATKALQGAGGNVFAVGGAVRDAVMGKEPKDIDLMVQGLDSADVKAVLESLPGKVDVTGKDFGVFRYRNQGNEVEIALPRKERSTGGGHKDFDVQHDPHMTPEEDLWRRDFSANAMAVNLANGQLLDPYGGEGDIERGVLRAHNPDALAEDPLRVVRALVANAKHGLVPDDATRQAMEDNVASLNHLPPERIQAELDKLFAAQYPHHAMRLAYETNALPYIFPEAHKCFGYDQNNPHHELQLGDHLLKVLERTAQRTQDPDVRLAGFLHDIGKPDSAWVDPERGTNHYYEKVMPDGTVLGKNHEDVGAGQARNAMTRLRYPNDRIKRVSELVQQHMWSPFTTQRGARRFLNRAREHADDLFDLRWADQGGKSEDPMDPTASLEMQRNLLDQVRNNQQPTTQADLAINGNDLIAAGIPQGPQVGAILQQLTQAVVDNPELNNRQTLLTMAEQHGTL